MTNRKTIYKDTLEDLTVKEYNRKIDALKMAYDALTKGGFYYEAEKLSAKIDFFTLSKADYLNNIK